MTGDFPRSDVGGRQGASPRRSHISLSDAPYELGQLASIAAAASSTVASPLTIAVACVQNVPAPTSAGIRSEPSKRSVSAEEAISRNDCSSGSHSDVSTLRLAVLKPDS